MSPHLRVETQVDRQEGALVGRYFKRSCAMRARQTNNRERLLTAAAVAAVAMPSICHAQTWVGPGGGVFSGTFSTASNWNPAAIPQPTATANFTLNQNYTVTFTAN